MKVHHTIAIYILDEQIPHWVAAVDTIASTGFLNLSGSHLVLDAGYGVSVLGYLLIQRELQVADVGAECAFQMLQGIEIILDVLVHD